MKRIEFGELRIGDTAKKYIQHCLDTDWISMGPKTELLEQKFAEIMGTKYAVATSSGTSSLVAVTLALEELCPRKVVRGKSNIICPALGFIANSTAIVSGRLKPNWVDVKPDTLNMDEELVEEAIDEDTVAIYAIGTMGRPSEMDKLKAIADKYDLILFEDACENYGSKFKGEFSHKYAVGGCSSMFQAHLVQAGEGSLVYTDSEKLRDLIVSIRSHGRHGKSAYFDHLRFGSNFKTTDLCASVALEGVEQFHQNIAERKNVWQQLVDYSAQFKDAAWFSEEPEHMEVMPHGFSITLKPELNGKISELTDIMDKYNIHWKRNFGFCGSHTALKEFVDKDYPWATWCGDNGIHVGTHRFMSQDDIDRINTAIGEFFNE